MASGEHLARKGLRDNGIGGLHGRYAVPADDPREHLAASGERLIDEVHPVEMQHVEEPRPQDLRTRGRSEPAYGVLEGARTTVLVQGERLAVEDERSARKARHDVDNLGQPLGDVGEGAREDAHLAARPTHAVNLDPGTVEFGLDSCDRRADASRPGRSLGRIFGRKVGIQRDNCGDSLGHRPGGRGEHGVHRGADLQSHGRHRVQRSGQGQVCRPAQ